MQVIKFILSVRKLEMMAILKAIEEFARKEISEDDELSKYVQNNWFTMRILKVNVLLLFRQSQQLPSSPICESPRRNPRALSCQAQTNQLQVLQYSPYLLQTVSLSYTRLQSLYIIKLCNLYKLYYALEHALFNRNQLFVVPVLDLARAPRRANRPRVRRALSTRMDL